MNRFLYVLPLSLLLLAACDRNRPQAETPAESAASPMTATAPVPAAASQGPSNPAAAAAAVLKPASGSEVSGSVTFTEMPDGGVRVAADISGLSPGLHGFHVHEKGDCSAPDASSAGGHFNPDSVQHGAPGAMSHHAGDLGNLTADANGHALLDTVVKGLTLTGPDSIVGRGLVVHGGEDDLKSQPAGNSGPRVACGVIEAAASPTA
jgi:Cu-Zn family superoxide dismutase